MNIVVLCGGLSRERDVSLCTGSMVTGALLKNGHNAVLVDVIGDYPVEGGDFVRYIETCRERGQTVVKVDKNAPDVDALRARVDAAGRGVFGENVLALCRAVDIVFMALHGEDGEDGKIQATFDMLRVKYTGSGYCGSAVAMSKRFSKQVFACSDIPSPAFVNITAQDYDPGMLAGVAVPCAVKASASGSSIGVFIVKNRQELEPAVKKALAMDDEVVIEAYVDGREFSCGVLGERALPVIEIIPNEGFYDYEHKYQPGATKEICPAQLSEKTALEIRKQAVRAHKALGLQVYSRVDFMVDGAGDVFCLEANTLPGMTPTSLLPQEAQAAGIGYEALCEKIIELSLKKYERE